jgi:CTP synthase
MHDTRTADAGSSELDAECASPVVIYMPEISKTHLGGTMRLGLRPSLFSEGSEKWSRIRKLYGGEPVVWERHRHRYEINPEYIERIERGDPSRSAGATPPSGGHARPVTPQSQTGRSGPRSLPTSPSLGSDAFSSILPQARAEGEGSRDTLRFVGRSESGERMQIAELVEHPYFVGMQAHPEFASRPLNPSPPFLGFVAAAVSQEALQEQMARQKNFRPPHPKARMLLESEAQRLQEQQGQTALPQEEKSAQTPPGVATPVRGRSPKAPGPNGVSTKAN